MRCSSVNAGVEPRTPGAAKFRCCGKNVSTSRELCRATDRALGRRDDSIAASELACLSGLSRLAATGLDPDLERRAAQDLRGSYLAEFGEERLEVPRIQRSALRAERQSTVRDDGDQGHELGTNAGPT